MVTIDKTNVETFLTNTQTYYRKINFASITPTVFDTFWFDLTDQPSQRTAFTLTSDGLTYILQQLGDIPDRAHARSLSGQALATYLANCMRQFLNENPNQDDVFIAACRDKKAYGFLRNYNPISNLQVWKMVREKLGEHNIKRMAWTEKEFVIHCSGQDIVPRVDFGLSICNGETGHVALGYRLYLKSDDIVVNAPFTSRNKHLSKIDTTLNNLTDVLQTVNQAQVDELFKTTKTTEITWPTYVTERLTIPNMSLSDLLIKHILPAQNKRGKKVAARKALQTIVEFITDKIGV